MYQNVIKYFGFYLPVLLNGPSQEQVFYRPYFGCTLKGTRLNIFNMSQWSRIRFSHSFIFPDP